MMKQDSKVRELGSTRPRLRSSLRFSFQEYGGQRCCVIENPLSSKFHRIGLAEYRLMTFLDGKSTFAEAFARASLACGAEALKEQQAVALLHWLVENRLADFGTGTPEDVLRETRDKDIKSKVRNVANLLFIKVPLGRPDALLDRLYPVFKPLCGWAFFAVWLAVVLAALAQLAIHWEPFVRGAGGILAVSNWLWLALVWVALKLWHELWHGVVCKHYDGEIREAGILFVLFTPMGYVDASSSWSFPSKWKRIHVAIAGMYGEIFIAAVAMQVWVATAPGVLNTVAINAVFMAGMVTILFNLNPLMRFDGYFILGDLLEIPNLYTKSNQFLKSLAKRWLLAVNEIDPPDWRDRETWIFLVYGLASLAWRLLIVFTLLVAASLMFRGGGLALAAVAFLFWLFPMVSSLVSYLREGSGSERPRLRPALVRLISITAVLLFIGFFPFSMTVRAPALVQYDGQVILRAECPGTVVGIHVRDGMEVAEGQLLVTLSNEEEDTALERIALRYEKQLVKSNLSRVERQVAEYEAEVSTRDALRKQHQEKLAFVETLDVTAPVAGRVMAPHLNSMRGRFLRTGDEMLTIARPEAVEVVVPISQNDIDFFRRHLGYPVAIRLTGRGESAQGILKRLTARASDQIDHPQLTSLAGGPLAVKSPDKDEEHRRLVEPVFWGWVQFLSDEAIGMRAGEPAAVKFKARQRRTFAWSAYTKVSHLIRWLFNRASVEET